MQKKVYSFTIFRSSSIFIGTIAARFGLMTTSLFPTLLLTCPNSFFMTADGGSVDFRSGLTGFCNFSRSSSLELSQSLLQEDKILVSELECCGIGGSDTTQVAIDDMLVVEAGDAASSRRDSAISWRLSLLGFLGGLASFCKIIKVGQEYPANHITSYFQAHH